MQILKTLRTVLPPPHYLQMPSVGVDVSDSSVKYTMFSHDGGYDRSLAIQHYGEMEVTPDTLGRGEVNNVDALADLFYEIKERTGTEYIRLSLPEERAYLFETQVASDTPFSEVRNLLEFRLEENVPLSPRDAYFDYEIYQLPNVKDQFGVSVTAYSCDTINGYYDACKKAGMTPLSFEVEAQAIARAILLKEDIGTYLIVDSGKMRTGVGIVHNGVLMYTSTIDIGGKQLSAALRRQLGEDVPEDELTKIKNTQGLVRDAKDNDIYDALIMTVSAMKDEIALRIEYWNNKEITSEDRFIEKVLLCGGTSNLKGFPEYLAETLDIETRRADVWQNVFPDMSASIPPIDRQHSYGYATAIGLGLANLI